MDKALKLITEKLKGINYAVIGSVNLQIQGMNVTPRDIDILTTEAGINKIDEILKEYRTEEIYFDESEGRNSFRSFYMIDGIEIEVLGNVNNIYRDLESLDRNVLINFKEMRIPCIPLGDELETYQKMGRKDKIKIIQTFLSK